MLEPPKATANSSYFQTRIVNELQLTPEQLTFRAREPYLNAYPQERDYQLFTEEPTGIGICYPTLDGSLEIYTENDLNQPREKLYKRIRLSAPVGEMKYVAPKGTGIRLFFPPPVVELYREAQAIETLVLVEGEFKSAALTFKTDLPAIGLSGIDCWHTKGEKSLHPDLLRFLHRVKVKNLVLMLDSDCLTVKYEPEKDLATRPYHFYSTVRDFKEAFKPFETQTDLYFAFPKVKYGKGIDDVLIANRGFESDIAGDLTNWGLRRDYFEVLPMADMPKAKLKAFFHLSSVNDFYTAYLNVLGDNEFIYNKGKYRYDDEKDELVEEVPPEAMKYIWVANDFFYLKESMNKRLGIPELTLVNYNKGTIIDRHSKEFLKKIPFYITFVTEPDNTPGYRRVIDGCYNRYYPPIHQPLESENCPPLTLSFLKHIFGESEAVNESTGEAISSLDLGLDYLQLLFLDPYQILPVLCLVSKENGTGKTTFGNWLQLIYCNNAAALGIKDLLGDFNSSWVTKNLIVIDEASLGGDKNLMNLIKRYSTSRRELMNQKGKDAIPVDFFGHWLFITNDETNFVKLNTHDIRFWIVKIPKLSTDNPAFLEQLREEIPAFLGWLMKRKMVSSNESRMWFHPSLLKTEAMKAVLESSKEPLQIAMEELFLEFFERFPKIESFELTRNDIHKLLNDRKYNLSKMTDNPLRDIARVMKEALGLQPSTNHRYRYPIYTEYDETTKSTATFWSKSEQGKPYLITREALKVAPEEIEEGSENLETDLITPPKDLFDLAGEPEKRTGPYKDKNGIFL